MKLVYVTIAGLALLSTAEAGWRKENRGNKGRGKGGHKKSKGKVSKKGHVYGTRDESEIEYKHDLRGNRKACENRKSMLSTIMGNGDTRTEAELEAAQEKALDHLEVIKEHPSFEEFCARCYEESDEFAAKELPSTTDDNCDRQANRQIMINFLAAACEPITGTKAKCTGHECSGKSNQGNNGNQKGLNFVMNPEHGIFSFLGEEVAEAITNVEEEDEESEEEEEDAVQAIGGKSRRAGFQVGADAKVAFSNAVGPVWNCVVSGGPEYCRDMFPNFPKIIKGKINPSNPNWYMIKKIRDSCVKLLEIIRTTKCTCQYLLWGNPVNWPRVSGTKHRDQAGKRIGQVCHYFSLLKGGCPKPRKMPLGSSCGNFGAGFGPQKKPNRPGKKPSKPSKEKEVLGSTGVVVANTDDLKGLIKVKHPDTGREHIFSKDEIKKMAIYLVLEFNDPRIYEVKLLSCRDKKRALTQKCGKSKKCKDQVSKGMQEKIDNIKTAMDRLNELKDVANSEITDDALADAMKPEYDNMVFEERK